MFGEFSPLSHEQEARAVREKLERLLPPDYGGRTVQEGWVEAVPSLADVLIRYPRLRGNFLTHVVRKALGNPEEQFAKNKREVVIGTMPNDAGYLSSGTGTMPSRFQVIDVLYEPINPVAGKNNSIRQTTAIFRTRATGDMEGRRYEDGLEFKVLEIEGQDDLFLEVGYHAFGIDDFEAHQSVKEFLEAGGFQSLYSSEGGQQADKLLGYCIAEAQRPAD